MKRRIVRWIAGTLGFLILAVGLAAYWVLATESGARWLLARVLPLLPAQLAVADVRGTLLRGVDLRTISWRDKQVDASVELVSARVELWPLLRRQVNVTEFDVTGVDVVIVTVPTDDSPGEAFVLDLPVDLLVDAASLTDARVSVNDSTVEISRLTLSGRLYGSALSISQFDLQSSLGDVALSGEGTLAGSYPASATATWELRRPDQTPLSGTLTLRGDSSGYEVMHALASPFAIRTQGQIALPESGIEFDLDNRWDEITLAARNDRALIARKGTLHLSGNIDNFAFDGEAAMFVDQLPPFELSLQGSRDGDLVSVRSLVVNSDAGRLAANGDVSIAPELSWNIAVQAFDLDPAVIDKRIKGNLDVVATSSGRFADGAPTATALVSDISGDFNDYPVKGSANLAYADEVFKAENAVIAIGENRANVTASMGEHLSLDATLSLMKLSQLGLDAAGTLTGDVQLETAPGMLRLGGTLRGLDLEWQQYAARNLDAEFAMPATGKGTIGLRLTGARLGNTDIPEGSVSVAGTIASHRLLAEVTALGASARVEATGGLVETRWAGSLDDFVVSGEPLGEWRLAEAANLAISPQDLQLGEACLTSSSSSGFVCAQFARDQSGTLGFDVSLSELPLAALPLVLPQGTQAAGMIEGRAKGNVIDGVIAADSSLEIREFGLDAVIDEEPVSLAFQRAAATATIVDNRLTSALELRLANNTDYLTGTLQVVDVLDPRSGVDGEALLELNDMSLFSLLAPDVANPVGRITGNLEVGGSLAAAELVGELGLADGSFGIRRAGITLTDVNLQLQQAEAGLLALQGSARSGEGYLDIDSKTSLSASDGIRSEVRIDGENFTLLRLPEWRLNASPAIVILLDEKATRISGDIVIPEADINIHELPTAAVRPSGDAVVHRPGQTEQTRRRPIYIDVRTVLGDDVNFSGFGLQTGLEGSVRISGSNNTTFASSGRVTLREGKYQAYGQDLTIESGELIFNGPLTNPSLNVRATRTASDNTVAGILLTGTPTQLRSEVYSEPPLADAEALSYLLTGRPLGSANAQDGDMLNQAAFALGLSSAGNVASRIRNDLGLETLGIQGGSENRQLVAGKRFGDRLLVEYAYGIVDNLGTLLLRYQLSNRLIIESRSGLARTVDLVYSVKKR